MESINKLLKRYSKITPPGDSVRVAAQQAIEQACGILVPKKNISYRSGVVICNISPTLRSEVLINKQKILEKIETILGKPIKDIR